MLDLGLGASNPTARISQVWDDENEWVTPDYLLGNENNFFVRFKPQFNGIRITGHVLSMHIDKIKLTFWSRLVNKSVTQVLTTAPEEVDLQSHPQVILGDPEKYASFDDDVDEEVPGTYKAKLEIHKPESVTVEGIWFHARDEGTYKRGGNN
jgi:hypothetical protein